jgi:GGDEF domain-containing protein
VHPRPGAFSDEARALAQTACDVCALAIHNVLLAEELRRATSTDSLTGAYNQRYFHVVVTQEVARARRTQKPFALVLLDIRNFHEVNQLLGPGGGDRVLRDVGQALAGQAEDRTPCSATPATASRWCSRQRTRSARARWWPACTRPCGRWR